MAAMTAHKVSTWENRCGEINTYSLLAVARHFSAPVKYCGVVLRKRSLAQGGEEMKSFVRHPKTSKGIAEIHDHRFFFKDQNKEAEATAKCTEAGKEAKVGRIRVSKRYKRPKNTKLPPDTLPLLSHGDTSSPR